MGDGPGRGGGGGSLVVAGGAAAFAGAGAGAAGAPGDEVGRSAQLGVEVDQGGGQGLRGERAARVAESRAASKARLKLIREGSSPPPSSAAVLMRSRTAW